MLCIYSNVVMLNSYIVEVVRIMRIFTTHTSFAVWVLVASFAICGFCHAVPIENEEANFTVTVPTIPNIPTLDVKPTGKMPIVGLGTWLAKDDELEQALEAALEAGYRHIDTAYVYENEKVIGKVLKKWLDSGKLKREDLFVVSKLPPCGNRPSGVAKYLQISLDDLQLDYLDMYLIHTPFAFADCNGDPHPLKDGKIILDTVTDHVATWKAMEEQVDNGKAKAIGLSNFNISQISHVLEHARIKPANLQIELHAYHQQVPLVDYAKKHGIVVTAYSPLGAPGLTKFMDSMSLDAKPVPTILNNPVILEIAAKHKKTAAQIVLRHGIQKGLIVIPKSTNKGRLMQNLDIFNFTLDDSDMTELNALNQDARLLDFKVFPGVEEHPEYPFKSSQ